MDCDAGAVEVLDAADADCAVPLVCAGVDLDGAGDLRFGRHCDWVDV